VFVVSVLVTLVFEGVVKPWQLALIASRDIVVTGAALAVIARRGIPSLRKMMPSLLGKLTTFAQCLFILAAVLSREVNLTLLIATSALSALAAIHYVVRFQ
jgi:phosphatidylglycerophosphate synthase